MFAKNITCILCDLTFSSLYKEERTDGSNSYVKWNCPNIHDLMNILEKVELEQVIGSVCDKRWTEISELPVIQLRDECMKLQLSKNGKKVQIAQILMLSN